MHVKKALDSRFRGNDGEERMAAFPNALKLWRGWITTQFFSLFFALKIAQQSLAPKFTSLTSGAFSFSTYGFQTSAPRSDASV